MNKNEFSMNSESNKITMITEQLSQNDIDEKDDDSQLIKEIEDICCAKNINNSEKNIVVNKNIFFGNNDDFEFRGCSIVKNNKILGFKGEYEIKQLDNKGGKIIIDGCFSRDMNLKRCYNVKTIERIWDCDEKKILGDDVEEYTGDLLVNYKKTKEGNTVIAGVLYDGKGRIKKINKGSRALSYKHGMKYGLIEIYNGTFKQGKLLNYRVNGLENEYMINTEIKNIILHHMDFAINRKMFDEVTKDGKIKFGDTDGKFEDDKIHYTGSVIGGTNCIPELTGKGKMKLKYNNGIVINGYFINGEIVGLESIKYRDGAEYTGEITVTYDKHRNIRFKRDGKGKTTYIDGRVYEGEYKDDMRHGYGTFIYGSNNNGSNEKNGRKKYVGNWKEGSMTVGKIMFSDGRVFEGRFFTKNSIENVICNGIMYKFNNSGEREIISKFLGGTEINKKESCFSDISFPDICKELDSIHNKKQLIYK